MSGFCVVNNEIRGCCHGVLPGLNEVALATLFVL